MNQDFRASNYKIFGDSHVHTIKRALRKLEDQIKKAGLPLTTVKAVAAANDFYVPFHTVDGGRIRFLSEGIIEKLDGEICDGRGYVVDQEDAFWFVSLGLHTYTFLSIRRWKTHRHWKVRRRSNLQPVSDAAFRDMALDFSRHILEFYGDAVRQGFRLAALSAPPPTQRFNLLSNGYELEDLLVMDRMFRAVVSERLQEMGIAVITPPEGVAENGFLKPELMSPNPVDAHHGNVIYSRRVLEKISSLAGYPLSDYLA